MFFFFKQKTAYKRRISDWSSDVCSSDLAQSRRLLVTGFAELALAPTREFERHPAFARLFVESECLSAESLLIFRRHLRGIAEKPLYLAHTVQTGRAS